MGVDPSCSSTCAFLRALSGRETSGSSETILLPSSVGVRRLDSLVPARVPPLRAAATGGRSIFCSGAPTSIIAIPRSLSQSHTGIPCFACARSCPPRPSSCVGGLAPSPSRGLGLVQSMTKPICAICHRPIAFDRNPLSVCLDYFVFCVFAFLSENF